MCGPWSGCDPRILRAMFVAPNDSANEVVSTCTWRSKNAAKQNNKQMNERRMNQSNTWLFVLRGVEVDLRIELRWATTPRGERQEEKHHDQGHLHRVTNQPEKHTRIKTKKTTICSRPVDVRLRFISEKIGIEEAQRNEHDDQNGERDFQLSTVGNVNTKYYRSKVYQTRAFFEKIRSEPLLRFLYSQKWAETLISVTTHRSDLIFEMQCYATWLMRWDRRIWRTAAKWQQTWSVATKKLWEQLTWLQSLQSMLRLNSRTFLNGETGDKKLEWK